MAFNKKSKIFIAGINGLVGRSLKKCLLKHGYTNICGESSSLIDLRKSNDVIKFFNTEKPEIVINAAATVGGILANNKYPYNFCIDNSLIECNIIENCLMNDVKKYIFLSSSCVYPKKSNQPIKEEYLLSGKLEPTNEFYAIAKILGVKLCEAARKQFEKNYFSVFPCNLYGPHDNFDLETSHVIPALIRKIHEAKKYCVKEVELWGSGEPLREFLYVDDLSEGIVRLMQQNKNETSYNIGSKREIKIYELAQIIKNIIGYKGKLKWNKKMPDGTPRKKLETSKINKIGWKEKHSLEEGLIKTYKWYLKNFKSLKEKKIN